VVSLAVAGYVIVSQLVAMHPLHGLLASYDRQIAALRATQTVPGLQNPAASAAHGAAAAANVAASGASQAQAIDARDGASSRARESAAAAALERSRNATSSAVARSTGQLAAETNANLRGYNEAMNERVERAYAARAQRLREQELTLAYDLLRRDAQQRLMLRLKLSDLHLTAEQRSALQAQLGALNGAEARSVDAMRSGNAAQLAAYRTQLERDASNANAQMEGQLRGKAGANYAILQRVFNEPEPAGVPSQAQLTVFGNSFAAARSAQAISAGFRAAGSDLAARFRSVGDADAASQRATAAQVGALETDRAALYRTIVAQIRSDAQAIARERHLTGVDFVAAPRHGLVNLTGAVGAQLARDW
jgi:hypothetical protein